MKPLTLLLASLASVVVGAPASAQCGQDFCADADSITGPGTFCVRAENTPPNSPADPESTTGLVESVWLVWTPCVTGLYTVAYAETQGSPTAHSRMAIYEFVWPGFCPGVFTGALSDGSVPPVVLAVTAGDTYYFEIGFDSVFPGTWWQGTVTISGASCPDNDGDGYDSSVDCNDFNPSVNPGAVEICGNGIDENCDSVDSACDNDLDGYDTTSDCDDSDASVNPGAVEICGNGIDENCDGIASLCDLDGDGYDTSVDCDDNNASVHPGAVELCANGVDENCDGTDPACSNGCGTSACGNADVIGPGPGDFCADSTGALVGPSSTALFDDVWLAWTPCLDGLHGFSYDSNFFFGVMRISDGCPGSELGITGGILGGEVTLSVSASQTYYLQVGNLAGSNFPYSGTITISGPTCPQPSINYCIAAPNSQDLGGAIISGTGYSVAANNLTLSCSPIAPGQPGIFYYGPLPITSAIPALGEGFRCVAGSAVRILPPTFSNGSGVLTDSVDNTNPFDNPAGALAAGNTVYFQAWYRDPNCPGPGGPGDCNQDGTDFGFNLSDGLSLTLLP